jgi:hypothetical protein
MRPFAWTAAALALLLATPALAEQAEALRPADSATVRGCFVASSARYAYDTRWPREVEGRGTEENLAYRRRLMLGWERALNDDYRARNIGPAGVQADAGDLAQEVSAFAKAFVTKETILQTNQKISACEGYRTGGLIAALDPAAFPAAPMGAAGRRIDDATLMRCLEMGELLRQVAGPGGAAMAGRFYQLRRERGAADYDRAVSAAFRAGVGKMYPAVAAGDQAWLSTLMDTCGAYL